MQIRLARSEEERLREVVRSEAKQAADELRTSRQIKGGRKRQLQKDEIMKDELFCTCQTPFQEGEDMISCDECSNWYHPACLEFSDNDALFVTGLVIWWCPACYSTWRRSQEKRKAKAKAHGEEDEDESDDGEESTGRKED